MLQHVATQYRLCLSIMRARIWKLASNSNIVTPFLDIFGGIQPLFCCFGVAKCTQDLLNMGRQGRSASYVLPPMQAGSCACRQYFEGICPITFVYYLFDLICSSGFGPFYPHRILTNSDFEYNDVPEAEELILKGQSSYWNCCMGFLHESWILANLQSSAAPPWCLCKVFQPQHVCCSSAARVSWRLLKLMWSFWFCTAIRAQL